MKERVKKIRKTLNLSQKEFGERLGVTDSAISIIESGRRNITEQMEKSICREFNVSYDWLKDGTGEMFDAIPETLVDELVQEFRLDDLDRRIILGYLRLASEERTVIKKYIQNVIDAQ
ncbi:MAG: helix-turn-helix transcriptional regulator [Eubacteriales bacterium]|nr:helix-turn-helix transcriptional regulator [Eubacteriales bacterium]